MGLLINGIGFFSGNWEYHPIYGIYSRIIYEKKSDDTIAMVGREYMDLKTYWTQQK